MIINFPQNRSKLMMRWAVVILWLTIAGVVLPVFLMGCGSKDTHEEQPPSLAERVNLVSATRDIYKNLISQVQDVDGFIEFMECDSVLFSGLVGASGIKINIRAARDDSGRWYRRPLSYEACYPKHSKSTISRDMFLGIFWYAWANKDLALLESLLEKGKTIDWVMGDGDISRTPMTPALQATLAEMIFKLGGNNHIVMRHYPQIWPNGLQGFELHLQLLHILLRGELVGAIDDSMLGVVKNAVQNQPNNALAQFIKAKYASGDLNLTLDVILNTAWFPSNRLPTARDRAEQWLWQRDYLNTEGVVSENWLPENKEKTHSGGDFMFIADRLLKYYFSR